MITSSKDLTDSNVIQKQHKELPREIINLEKTGKIIIIFSKFLILWVALAFTSSHVLNVCKRADLRFEKYCKDSYYIRCLTTSIFSKIFCHYSTLENTIAPFATALGLTMISNSRYVKNLIMDYIHT